MEQRDGTTQRLLTGGVMAVQDDGGAVDEAGERTRFRGRSECRFPYGTMDSGIGTDYLRAGWNGSMYGQGRSGISFRGWRVSAEAAFRYPLALIQPV
mgnify:CR=1 FL=1